LVSFYLEGGMKYRSGNQEYISKFPEKILYLQRRNAYRAMVPRTYTVYCVFRSSEDERTFKGRLQDISGSGFKAYFKGLVGEHLKAIGNFDESTLHVGDESMDCGLDARHAIYNDEKDMTFCGFSFHPLSGMKQRYIEQLVNKLQFEEQRKQQAAKDKKEADTEEKEHKTVKFSCRFNGYLANLDTDCKADDSLLPRPRPTKVKNRPLFYLLVLTLFSFYPLPLPCPIQYL